MQPRNLEIQKKATVSLPYSEITSGFWPRMRARLFELIATPSGALRAVPPPIAASLLLIRPSKIYKTYWAAHVKGFFLPTGPQML
jgi:hypothetical protein